MRKLLLIFLFGIGMHFCYAQQSGTPAGTAMPQTQAWVNGTGTTGTLSLYFGSSQYFQIPTYKQFLDSLVNAIKYADTTSKIETRYHALHAYQPLLTGLTFGTTGTDFNGSITGSTLALNIPDASGTARGLINLGNQTLGTAGTTKTFAGNVIVNQLLSLASTFQSSTGGATSSNLYVLSSTVSNITTAKYLFGGTTGVYYRMLLNGNNSGNLTGANNYASSIWADHTVPVVTAITIPVASQLVVKNFTLSLAGTAAVTEKDGLYLEAQKGGVNNYSMHALGKVKIDQHALGVAGTDSLLVSNGGEVKTIPANYYAPASGIAGYVPYTGATADVNLGANSLTVPRIYGGVATTDTARISPYPTSTAKMLGSDKGFVFTTAGPFVAGINSTIQISDLWLNQPTVKRSLFISSSQSNTTGTNIGGTILAATNISIPATNTGNITSHLAYNMNITAAAGATGTVTNFGGNQIFVSNNATGLTATNMFGQIITVANSGPNTNTVGLGIRGVFGTPTGKYSLYNDLALPSYTAANTLLGGLIDNGVDKLQITGGLLANGQAHYGAGRTLGALDFMYKQKADSLYAASSSTISSVAFGTTGTDPNGNITNGVLTINLPTMAATGINVGLLNNTTQTIPGTKTFGNGLISAGPAILGNTNFASANFYVAQTYSTATLAKFLFGGVTTSVARTWVGGGTNAVIGAASNYAGTLLADNPVSVATGITVPIASQLVVKNFTPALTGTGAITEKDGLYIENQTGGVNNYSLHALGKVKIDQHAAGVAGTDSLLVSNAGEIKAIPANYYAPAAGLTSFVPYTGANADVNLGAHSIIAANSLALPNNASFLSNGVYNNPTNIIRDYASQSSAVATTGPNNTRLIGAVFAPSIGAANTQNWTVGAGAVVGVVSNPSVSSGASGTINRIIGLSDNVFLSSNLATVTYWDMLCSNVTNSGAIVNSSYIHTTQELPGGNTAFILHNWSLTAAYPTGHWFLYNNTSDINYLGTGATLINTTIDNGVDKLQVNGTIHAKGVKVDLNFPAPDYVFDAGYKLASLPEVKKYIDANHHLAEIPSAQQIAKDGIDLGEMNAKLLKKVEELTLYLINKDKEDQQRQQLITEQQQQINDLKKQVENLAATIKRN